MKKKLMLLIAMLAVVLTLVLPAAADVNDSGNGIGNGNSVECNAALASADQLSVAISTAIAQGDQSTADLLLSILADLSNVID